MRIMLVVLPPLVFTLLVTNRRLGFVVLAVGLALVALLLLRTRRDLFLRLVPLVLVGLVFTPPLLERYRDAQPADSRRALHGCARRPSATAPPMPGGTWRI